MNSVQNVLSGVYILCWILFLTPAAWYCLLALMLLVGGRKGIQPVTWWVAGMVLSGARCSCAYGQAEATATHCLLLPLNVCSRQNYFFFRLLKAFFHVYVNKNITKLAVKC